MARKNTNKEVIEWDEPVNEEIVWDEPEVEWSDGSTSGEEYEGSKWMMDVGKTVASLGDVDVPEAYDIEEGEYEGIPFLKDHLTTENFLKAVSAPFYPLQKAREGMTAALNMAAKDPVTGKVLGWLDDETEISQDYLPGLADAPDFMPGGREPAGTVPPVAESLPVAAELAAIHPYTVGAVRSLKGAAKLAGKPVSRLFTGLGEGGVEGAGIGDTRGLAAETADLTSAQSGLANVTKTPGQFTTRTKGVKTVGGKGGKPDTRAPIYSPEEAAHKAPRPAVSATGEPMGEARSTEDILLDIEIDRTVANPPIHPGAERVTPEATGMPGVRRTATPSQPTPLDPAAAAEEMALDRGVSAPAHPGATQAGTQPQDVSTIFKRGGAGEPMTVGELPAGGPEDFLPIRPGVAHPGATGAPGPLPVENAAINAGNAEEIINTKATLQDRFLSEKAAQQGAPVTGTAPRVGAPRPQTRGVSTIPDAELGQPGGLPPARGPAPAPVAEEAVPAAERAAFQLETAEEKVAAATEGLEKEGGIVIEQDQKIIDAMDDAPIQSTEMEEATAEALEAIEREEAAGLHADIEDMGTGQAIEANLSFEGEGGAASQEGINAVASMKRQGIKRKIIKGNTVREQPLTVDARDYVPKRGEVVIEIHPEEGTTIVSMGEGVEQVQAQNMVKRVMRGDESHMLEGIDEAIKGLKTHDHVTNLRRMVDAGKLQPEQAEQIQQAIEIVAAEKGKEGMRAMDVLKRVRKPKGHLAGEGFDVTAEATEVPEAATYEIPDSDYDLPDSVLEPYEPEVGTDTSLKRTGFVSEEETQAQLDKLMAEKGIAPEDLGLAEKPAFDVEAPAPEAEKLVVPRTQKEIKSKLAELGQEEFNHRYNPINLEAQLYKQLKAEGMSDKAARANARARMVKYEKDYNKVNEGALKARAAVAAKKEAKLAEHIHGLPAPVYGHINLVEHPAYAIGLERAAEFRLQDFSNRMVSYARDYNPEALKDALRAEQLFASGARREGAKVAERVVESFRKQAYNATGGNPEYLDTMRSPKQILDDIRKAMGERGTVGAHDLTPQQREAIQRLKRDYDSLKKRASITGRSVREFLMDNGYSEEMANAVIKGVEKTAPIAEAAQESTEDLRTFFDNKFTNTREGIDKTVKGAKEFINTPIVAARKDKVAREAIKVADRADIQGQAFAADRSKTFAKVTKKLKKDYAARDRIGAWLDNADNVTDAERAAHYGLNAEETKVAEWMKEEFDDLLWHWGRERLVSAGEPASQLKVIAEMAEAGAEPIGLTKAEAEVYDVFRRKIKDYLPHIFDRRDLAAELAAEIKITTDPAKLTKLQASLHDVQGGRMLLFEQLPDKVKMRFFSPRKGKEGFSLDAFEAYNTYLQGITRKMFDEPVVRHIKSVFPQISAEYQPFMSEFTRNYMGWNRKGTDGLEPQGNGCLLAYNQISRVDAYPWIEPPISVCQSDSGCEYNSRSWAKSKPVSLPEDVHS
jgi:hypothetical protein